MSNQRKKTYQTYEQSRFRRRSASSIYLAESSSTLTASSHDSLDLDSEESDWCAQKVRSQRHKMEKLLVCYEQQRKCIAELEEYIDELERSSAAKDEQIKQLEASKVRENELSEMESNLQRELVRDEQLEKTRMMTLLNTQLRTYDRERHRFQKELEAKEQEIIDERQEFEQQIDANHHFYKEKILKIELKWHALEKDMAAQIAALQKDKTELENRNKVMSEQLQSKNQFEEILKLRRELSQREAQLAAGTHQLDTDNQLLRDEVQRAKAEIKRLKKDNYRLKNELQTKMFDYEMEQKIASNLEARRDRSSKKQENSAQHQAKLDKMAQELRQAKKDLIEYQRKCQDLSIKNLSLEKEVKQLQDLLSHRAQDQQKWQSLRKEEHKEIQQLNRLFRKIDFDI